MQCDREDQDRNRVRSAPLVLFKKKSKRKRAAKKKQKHRHAACPPNRKKVILGQSSGPLILRCSVILCALFKMPRGSSQRKDESTDRALKLACRAARGEERAVRSLRTSLATIANSMGDVERVMEQSARALRELRAMHQGTRKRSAAESSSDSSSAAAAGAASGSDEEREKPPKRKRAKLRKASRRADDGDGVQPACTECRTAKRSCDHGNPCTRCRHMKKACQYVPRKPYDASLRKRAANGKHPPDVPLDRQEEEAGDLENDAASTDESVHYDEEEEEESVEV